MLEPLDTAPLHSAAEADCGVAVQLIQFQGVFALSVNRVVRLADLVEQPWKNGGGSTKLVVSGRGWRVSEATVACDGTFSVFEGCKRHSVVLAGGTILLEAGKTDVALDPHSVVAYPGSIEWNCHLQGDAAAVLNVICDERIAEATLEKSGRHCVAPKDRTVALCAVNCSATCKPDDGGSPMTIPAGHVFLCGEQIVAWTCTSDSPATDSAYLLAILINPHTVHEGVFYD